MNKMNLLRIGQVVCLGMIGLGIFSLLFIKSWSMWTDTIFLAMVFFLFGGVALGVFHRHAEWDEADKGIRENKSEVKND